MLNNLLGIVRGDGSSVAGQVKDSGNWYFDNYGEPFLYALIGFVVVFVGIILLIFIIWLVGFIFRKIDGASASKQNKKQEDKQEAIKALDNVEAPSAYNSEESDEVPPEVKVAIVAAIMAFYGTEQKKCEFTVKRIKRL